MERRRDGGLFPATYRLVRSSLVPLIRDPDVGVRADVAVAIAGRKDLVVAPTLLGLIEIEHTLEPWRPSNVVQAIHTLTGSYFGLTPGTPSPAVRAEAFANFAQWIKEHPAAP